MTPEERQLIADLFDRMRSTDLSEKDRDAEALINQSARATPDAAYKMVQSVLVMEHTLTEANYRIEELEARVRELEEYGRGQQRQPASSGSFLGGLFGGSKAPAQPPQSYQASPSVPTIGSQRAGYGQQSGSPWAQQQHQQQPMQQGGMMGQPQRTGGSFMRTAAATAVGVAGGVMAASAISNMMGGANSGNAQAGQGNQTTAAQPSPYEVAQDDTASGWESSDSSDSGGGWDSGGGDSDI
jgi:uncharacterized protein